ncbi:GNAT family N-acetyltransferase [Catellatospora citrea]|uniref:N-acetyltransferase n=1 Tax=Catellatospora citrea TaxID=53366 RepID=A0A8J3KVG6_9ACTN|nr:GNAT family N-acetyltransferase [Catellatospora citrea]RKE02769.1 N-acetylglutamate synthase-like GNAT family acetyltransferase [Catellatospora citrea]GIG02650.1 N-acetyltransferase [Catellatospora citrea]
MRIRTAQPDDAAAVVALRAEVYPYLVRGVASTRQMIAEPPAGDWTAFVVEDGGQLVGWTSAFRNITTSEADFGEISLLHVHPAHRRQGAGKLLFDAAARHLSGLGVQRVRAWVQQESLDFARGRGFTPSRELRYSMLETRLAPPAPDAPPGVTVVPLSGLDEHVLYTAYVAASADEPGDVPSDELSFDTWRYEVWDNLGLDKDASVAALDGGQIVAFTLVKRDGERMWSDMTATLPEHRGRGLARLAKTVALHRAAAGGVTAAYTSNDESNAPMLAVNARLGYRPVTVQWSCLGTLPGSNAA